MRASLEGSWPPFCLRLGCPAYRAATVLQNLGATAHLPESALSHSATPTLPRRNSPLDSQLIKRYASVQGAFDECLPGLLADIQSRNIQKKKSRRFSPGQASPLIRLQWARRTYAPFRVFRVLLSVRGKGHNWLSLNDLFFSPEKYRVCFLNPVYSSWCHRLTIPLPINSRIKSSSWNYPVQAIQITTFWILTPRESQDKGKSMASVRQNPTEPRDCTISESPPAPSKTRVRQNQRLLTMATTLAFCQPSALSTWAHPIRRHCILSNRLLSPTGS